MTGPKVGDATHVVVQRTGAQQQVTEERAAELKKRFYPTLFRDGVDTRVTTRVADNDTPVIATPGQQTVEVRPLDDGAIDTLVSGALAAGVSSDRRAQTVKALLLQDRPDAALALLQGVNQQGGLGELLIALSTLDGPGTWTTRLALSANDPNALALVMSYAPAGARAAALSVLAPIAESDAGHTAARQLLSAASRDQSLEQLVRQLDNIPCGDLATVREILIASMAARQDSVSLLMLGASGTPVPEPKVPQEKIDKAGATEPEPTIRPSTALSPATVTEVIKASTPEIFVPKVDRGLREHPEAAQRALAALATLRSQSMVVVAEGTQTGGVAKEAYWGVISADDYAAQYAAGLGHDGMNRTRPGEILPWELTEATRYVDEVLNCTFEDGVWRPRNPQETVAVLRERYPRVFGPSSDGRVHFNGERINAPPYEIRGNELVSNVETFKPAEFALAIAETNSMLVFHDLATAHPEIAAYDGQRQLTVRTGTGEIRLVIRGDRVYSPDAPDDVRATSADVNAWVTRVARPEPATSAAAASTAQPAALQSLTAAARAWQADLKDQLGYAGLNLVSTTNNQVSLAAVEEGGTEHAIATLSLVDNDGRRLTAEALVANAELALMEFLGTTTQPMPAHPEIPWRSVLHEADHYAKSLGHAGVVAVPHGSDPARTNGAAFDPNLTYDFYLIDAQGGRAKAAELKIATSGGAEMYTPSVCIREVRAGIYERHAQLSPAAIDMTPRSWEQLNGWLQNRERVLTRATVDGGSVTWRDDAGGSHRVNLDLPGNLQLQVVDGNILRVVNTTGTFRAVGPSGPIESRDLFITFTPGAARPYQYLFGTLPGELDELGPAIEGLAFDSSTATINIGGRELAVRGPGLAERYQLVSGLTANHSALIYNAQSGKLELGYGWLGDDGGVARFLDDDVSDGSAVIHVDYSGIGEGVQVWRIDLDFESGDAGQSYDARCILNTTSAPITAAQDFTDTDAARAELAWLGVAYQPSTRPVSFADAVAGSTIDGNVLLQSLQTVPDPEAGRALDTLLALDPSRISPSESFYFAVQQMTVVESIVALGQSPDQAVTLNEESFNELMARLADAHATFVVTQGNVQAGTATMRQLIRQAVATAPTNVDARLNVFLRLANQEIARLRG